MCSGLPGLFPAFEPKRCPLRISSLHINHCMLGACWVQQGHHFTQIKGSAMPCPAGWSPWEGH
jgi:hypothetical protein